MFNKLKKKVGVDSANGVLAAMLLEKGINLSTDADNCVLAVGHDASFKSFGKLSKKFQRQETLNWLLDKAN